jgi:hypothetical protein
VEIECVFVGKRTFGPVIVAGCRAAAPAEPPIASESQPVAEPEPVDLPVSALVVPELPVPPDTDAEAALEPLAEPSPPFRPIAEQAAPVPISEAAENDARLLRAIAVLVGLAVGLWLVISYVSYLNEAFGFRFWSGRLALGLGVGCFLVGAFAAETPSGQAWALGAAAALTLWLVLRNMFDIGPIHSIMIAPAQVLAAMLGFAFVVALLLRISGGTSSARRRNG